MSALDELNMAYVSLLGQFRAVNMFIASFNSFVSFAYFRKVDPV